ncbi:hypothetical protein Bca4012_059917 [Brassica carinata]
MSGWFESVILMTKFHFNGLFPVNCCPLASITTIAKLHIISLNHRSETLLSIAALNPFAARKDARLTTNLHRSRLDLYPFFVSSIVRSLS